MFTVGQSFEQLDLFTDYAALEVKKKEVQEERNGKKCSESGFGYKKEVREECGIKRNESD